MGIQQNSIAADRLDQLIGTADCPVIIDVRKEKAFSESDLMIATAAWRHPERVAEWSGELPRDIAIIAYCVHGHEVSQGAAAALRAAGLDAVFLERIRIDANRDC